MKKIRFLLPAFLLAATPVLAQQKLFSLLHPDSTGVGFINHIMDSKTLNVVSYEYFYNGAGVSAGDVNNDGLTDLYFTSNVGDCKLYINQGGLRFRDMTDAAGVTGGVGYKTGAVMADVNHDGWLDIYVCRSVAADPRQRQNLLYINNRNGTFTNKAVEMGVADPGFAMCAYFNDLDGDGDLDLLVLNHPYNLNNAKTIHLTYNKKGELEAVKDKPTPYESNQYYENVNGKFVNKTAAAGLATRSFGLSAILEDFNNDGLTDIYQANDYLEPDYLFINKGGGKFVNEYDRFFRHGSYSSMGSDFADINNDGYSDLMTTDMLPEGNYRQKQLRRGNNYDEFEKVVKYGYGYQFVKNVLQLNNGNGSFSDISYYTGTAFSDWSWGVLINDFDNDGLKDIYIANGYMRDITDMDYVRFKMDSVKKALIRTGSQEDVLKLLSVIPSVKVLKSYFRNYGNLDFRKETKESGLDQPAWSFGCAYADLDNDGDLEIIVNNVNDPAFIYRNNTTETSDNRSVSVTLKGSAQNPFGLGARIKVTTPDQVSRYFVANTMRGYLSNNDNKIIVGIGTQPAARVEVSWPDGRVQEKEARAGETVMLDHQSSSDRLPALPPVRSLFTDITAETGIRFQHRENAYIDFKLEPMLPHRFSRLGPSIAVTDLNKDGLEDFVTGAAKDEVTAVFLQNADGTFRQQSQPGLAADKIYEDGAIAFADLDKDGIADMIISTGGNDYGRDLTKYPVRFYRNDGNGNFTKYPAPVILTSSNAIAVGDFNEDGQTDIFIGGSTLPGHYGRIPASFLLTIEKGAIRDITPEQLRQPGMVKSASWRDMDHDGWLDLVLAGEWMPVTIYYGSPRGLDTIPYGIPETYGWWNKLQFADLDKDGDLDIIGGNLGLNTRYTGTTDKPVTMVVSDFDNNGSTDCIISTYIRNNSFPIAIRDYVLDQMPFLRKKYLRYSQYANATVPEMFSPEQLAKASSFLANNMSSAVFMNKGRNEFETKRLPPEAQLFPVTGIQVADINRDGITDLLLAGNDYSTEVETGRNDAGIGLVLLGDGKGSFRPLPVTRSGFYVPGDVKCLEWIRIGGQPCLIAGKNSDFIQLIKPTQ